MPSSLLLLLHRHRLGSCPMTFEDEEEMEKGRGIIRLKFEFPPFTLNVETGVDKDVNWDWRNLLNRDRLSMGGTSTRELWEES